MKYKLQLSFLILILMDLNVSNAQAGMNLGLHRRVLEAPESSQLISVLVKGQTSCVSELTLLSGGSIVAVAGDISSIYIPVRSLKTLLESSCVQRIEAYSEKIKVMNDTMRVLCRVDEVHQGLPPLAQSYKGRDVLIGYIDSGLDLNHPDFQDSLGNTRVAWLWDMTKPVAVNTPMPYGYGQEWSQADINSGLAVSHTGEDQFGHGTYVAGIGSGNGNAVGHFEGVAPESDILIVSFDFNAADTVSRMAHAIDYLFSKAALLGKPCVINASLGDYLGSHDGKDLQSQFVSNLISMQAGRVVVAAAGNIGLYPFHVGRNSVVGDTSFTWFKYNPAYPGAYVQIFADTADFNQISYSIGADKVTPYFSSRGSTAFANVSSTLNNVITQNLYNGPNRIGIIQTVASLNDGVYELEIYIQPDSLDYIWRFTTTGNGYFDSWSFDWEFQSLPSPGSFPPIVDYHLPDTFQTIVTGIACLDNVITVGNYFNTDRHVDVNGTLQISAGDQPGNLAGNSSRGPTRDGRIKPEITAPGHHIISAGVLTQIPGMIAAQPYKVAQGAHHVTGGGTSASAPVVAGIAALYLEQNPAADWMDIKNAIIACAMQDQHTWAPLPNNAWGYGKADAFGVLTACSPVAISKKPTEEFSVQVFPSPSSGVLNVNISTSEDHFPITLEIIDPLGRRLGSFQMPGDAINLNLSSYSQGMYWLKYRSNNGAVLGHKAFILRH